MPNVDHTATASYASSGFSNRMSWGSRPALLLIDVCCAYWTPGSPLDCSSNPAAVAALPSMRRLLAAARQAGIPVVWTAIRYKKDMSDAGLFWLKSKNLDVWKEGDERGFDAWVEGLVPDDGRGDRETVVWKKMPSGFFGTELAEVLRERGVDTVVCCGVSTSGCVRATALDAMQSGFRPMVSAPVFLYELRKSLGKFGIRIGDADIV
ncbi:hypothetical protein LTS18_007656 [Coniosporium uncinatum]|uniref:Uncharacterized protein n=1 Tax=Coniosporium uncinatum TaxID=93489 RepID=A0ACC3D2V6_9PEZI|nr:hypothetical protein LTS18_007656 [Coniosporium uncinatum]